MLKQSLVMAMLVLAVIAPSAASAQNRAGQPGERLRFQVWRTREMLDFIGERVRSCRDELGSAALAAALAADSARGNPGRGRSRQPPGP